MAELLETELVSRAVNVALSMDGAMSDRIIADRLPNTMISLIPKIKERQTPPFPVATPAVSVFEETVFAKISY